MSSNTYYVLDYLHFISGTNVLSQATIKLTINKKGITNSGNGNNVLDAVFNTINKMVNDSIKLFDCKVKTLINPGLS